MKIGWIGQTRDNKKIKAGGVMVKTLREGSFRKTILEQTVKGGFFSFPFYGLTLIISFVAYIKIFLRSFELENVKQKL